LAYFLFIFQTKYFSGVFAMVSATLSSFLVAASQISAQNITTFPKADVFYFREDLKNLNLFEEIL
jgi:hypothetical protein